MSKERATKVDQQKQQTNIAGDVHGPVLSGEFHGDIHVNTTEITAEELIHILESKVDAELLQVLKDQLRQAVSDLKRQVTVTGDGNIIGDNNQVIRIENTSLQQVLKEWRKESARSRRSIYLVGIPTLVVFVMLLSILSYTVLRSFTTAETPVAFPTATGEETLIIIAPFTGALKNAEVFPEYYVRDALNARVKRLNLSGYAARLEMWATPVSTQREARTLGEAYNATLVIWGEFDNVGGLCTFVEIIRDVPAHDIQQSGDRLPLAISMAEDTEYEISQISRECFLEGQPRQADYLATMALGMICLAQGERDQAEDLFTQAIETVQLQNTCQESPYQAYYWRGFTRSLQERFPEALDDLEQSINLNPDFSLALLQRGIVYLAIGHAADAQASFEAALALVYPEDLASRAALLGNIGLALEMQNKLDQALVNYQQSWELNQGSNDLIAQVINLEQFASLYQHLKQWEDALDYHNRALELAKTAGYRQGESLALGNIGLIYQQEGDLDKAWEYHQEALAIDESIGYTLGQARQLCRIAMIYVDRSEYVSAMNTFTVALEFYTEAGSSYGQARVYMGMGLVEQQRGNTVKALQYLQEAITLFEKIGSPEAEEVRSTIQSP